MKRLSIAGVIVLLLLNARGVEAHPSPFSYVDLRLQPDRLDLTLVVHVFDVAHDLQLEPPERLLEGGVLAERGSVILGMFGPRLNVLVDGRPLPPPAWTSLEPIAERQSLRMRATYALNGRPGVVTLRMAMFVYDPVHQTFVNAYENDALELQAILDGNKRQVDYFSGSRRGATAVTRRFTQTGFAHILSGADHLLFLAGLVLLGGSLRWLTIVVTAFTAANVVTLSVAALGVLRPPASIVEPALALSIIYLGIDNLMVRGGRDMRGWIAFAFGLIHGFGFANVLTAMDLPRRAFGWSIFSFNLGVELAQLLVVLILGGAILAVHHRRPAIALRMVSIGSIIVSLAGAYWFIERVFFPGGIV